MSSITLCKLSEYSEQAEIVIKQIKKHTTREDFDALLEKHVTFELDQRGRACHVLLQAIFQQNNILTQHILALSAKALLNLSSTSFFSPLIAAIHDQKLKEVKILLINGVDVNCIPNPDVYSPLYQAYKSHQVALAQLLRGYGAQLKANEKYYNLSLPSMYSSSTPLLPIGQLLDEWDEGFVKEKAPIKRMLDETLTEPAFQQVNTMIMEYIVPPSMEIHYTATHTGIESASLKEFVDAVLPTYPSRIVADYARTSSVEITLLEN